LIYGAEFKRIIVNTVESEQMEEPAIATMTNKWTTEWPKKEGLYWFCGWQTKYSLLHEEPRLEVFRVMAAGQPDSRWFAYICNGASVWESEGGKGYFLPINAPTDLPDVEALK
jgi:hypothetical protein